MDLSMKKPVSEVPQDLPQDLSVKKRGTLATSTLGWSEDPTPRISPHRSSGKHLLDQKLGTRSDHFVRPGVDLTSNTLADKTLRTLAHQKAKTLAGQYTKTHLDLRLKALVIPKPSALVVPNPRRRTLFNHRTQTRVAESETSTHKSRPAVAQSLPSIETQQVIDLRKKHAKTCVSPERSLSNHPQNESVSNAHHTLPHSQPSSPSVLNGYSSSTPTSSESHPPLSKRKRKQECPRKRIKLDSYLPEEVDPAYLVSEEFLDKVTGTAHNGELRKNLDAYFPDSAQGQSPSDPDNSLEENAEASLSDSAQDHHLNDSSDATQESDSTTQTSFSDSLSSLNTPGSKKLKPKQPRISASLQNREKRKTLRLYGKEYTTPSGKTYPSRSVRDKDCSKCRYNCSTNISMEQRQNIFEHFWSLDSYVKRLYYYCQSIKEKPAKTMKHTRECSREYTFLVERERVRVCKGFYLATLDVSDKAVRIAMEKRKRGKGMWDKRGAHPPHNKTRPEDKDRVRGHIESFLIIDIYTKTCDNSSTTPGQDLNVTKMHQDYVLQCKAEDREAVSEDVYRKTFNTEYNLSTVQV